MKLKWKVADAPTGRYRSFSHRGWPTAYYPNGQYAGTIYCEDDYCGRRARGELAHKPLTVHMKALCTTDEERQKYGAFKSLRLKATFATLKEAKAALEAWCTKNPQIEVEQKSDSLETPPHE